MRRRLNIPLVVLTVSALALAGCATTASSSESTANTGAVASTYPTKPITLVVAWSAGGGTDIMARAFSQSAATQLGQPMNVIDKPGGSGAVGWGEIAHSTKADGYTLSIVSPEIGFLRETGLYDFGLENFTLITLVNQDSAALAVRADAPWKTLDEFIAAAKAKPGSISVGNSGPGLVWDLATTSIERAAKVKLTHVPYSGAAGAVQAVLGGSIGAMTFSLGEVSSQVKAGSMRVLALAANERNSAYPDVPTFNEAGYKVEIGTFRGIAGPAGMDPSVVSKLNDAFVKMATEKTFTSVMNNNSYGIKVMPTTEFKTFFDGASSMYKSLLKPAA